MKVEIQSKSLLQILLIQKLEWSAVGVWKWNVKNETVCGICRNPFESTCPEVRDSFTFCIFYSHNSSVKLQEMIVH